MLPGCPSPPLPPTVGTAVPGRGAPPRTLYRQFPRMAVLAVERSEVEAVSVVEESRWSGPQCTPELLVRKKPLLQFSDWCCHRLRIRGQTLGEAQRDLLTVFRQPLFPRVTACLPLATRGSVQVLWLLRLPSGGDRGLDLSSGLFRVFERNHEKGVYLATRWCSGHGQPVVVQGGSRSRTRLPQAVSELKENLPASS